MFIHQLYQHVKITLRAKSNYMSAKNNTGFTLLQCFNSWSFKNLRTQLKFRTDQHPGTREHSQLTKNMLLPKIWNATWCWNPSSCHNHNVLGLPVLQHTGNITQLSHNYITTICAKCSPVMKFMKTVGQMVATTKPASELTKTITFSIKTSRTFHNAWKLGDAFFFLISLL